MSVIWLVILLIAKLGFHVEFDIMLWFLVIPLYWGDDKIVDLLRAIGLYK